MLTRVERFLLTAYAWVRSELAVLAALFVVAGGLLAFVEIADDMHEGDTTEVDRAILLVLRQSDDIGKPRGPEWLVKAMVDVTSLGSVTVVTLVTVFTTGFLLVARRPLSALLASLSAASGGLVMHLLKLSFGRTRPDVVPHLVDVTSASFPSGHAMLSTTVYLTLAVIVVETSNRRVGIYVMSIAVLLALAIGFSRVYLGVHYPTDVLAGWCAGVAWALLCWLLTNRLVRRQSVPR